MLRFDKSPKYKRRRRRAALVAVCIPAMVVCAYCVGMAGPVPDCDSWRAAYGVPCVTDDGKRVIKQL